MKNPKVLDCTRESILQSVMQCAQLGLEPILGRAYLIPYENSKRHGNSWIKVLECQFQAGYQGLVDLARRSDQITDIFAECVFEKDFFEIDYGTNRRMLHKPALTGERGNIIGAYAVWEHKNGIRPFEWMRIDDIYKRRDSSTAYRYAKANPNNKNAQLTPWIQWPEEMIRKTVIKHSAKLQPASIEFMQAVELDDIADSGRGQSGFFDDHLILPESDPRPIKTEVPVTQPNFLTDQKSDLRARFIGAMGDLADDFKLTQFVNGSAVANNTDDIAVMRAAIDNADEFKTAFVAWKQKQATFNMGGQNQMPVTEKKTEPVSDDWSDWVNGWNRMHGKNFKAFVAQNLETFKNAPDWIQKKAAKKYEQKVDEPWPLNLNTAADDAIQGKKADITEGDSKGQAEIVQPAASEAVDITQTDEFNELSMLKERYPDIYSEVMKNNAIRTVADIEIAIRDISAAVAFEKGP
jgi:recombination protein RecT